jgi:protein gp37
MNKSKIDWTDYSWNPITGCRHNCPYCYARKQSARFSGDIRLNKTSKDCQYDSERGLYVLDKPFITRENRALNYPYGFEPTLHKYRLDWPGKIKNGRNIFVGSMSDVFGDWVPDEWISMIFEACKQYPQHNYMFLTKNPKRYMELAEKNILPAAENFWYGSSTPTPDTEFFWHDQLNTFVSIEPILEPWPDVVPAEIVKKVNWIIIGAETGNRRDKVIPKRDWIITLVKQCMEAKIPVFLKDNLQDVMGKDYDLKPLQEFPEELKRKVGVEDQKESAWYKKMYGQCALCKEEKLKKEMIALLARAKRGTGAKQLAYVCRGCYEKLCEDLGVIPPELGV